MQRPRTGALPASSNCLDRRGDPCKEHSHAQQTEIRQQWQPFRFEVGLEVGLEVRLALRFALERQQPLNRESPPLRSALPAGTSFLSVRAECGSPDDAGTMPGARLPQTSRESKRNVVSCALRRQRAQCGCVALSNTFISPATSAEGTNNATEAPSSSQLCPMSRVSA